MLVGAGSSYAVNSTGGASTVTLTAAQSGIPEHGHGFTQPTIGPAGAHSHSWNGYHTIPRKWDAGDEVKAHSRTKMSSDPADTSTNSVGDHTHTVSGGAV